MAESHLPSRGRRRPPGDADLRRPGRKVNVFTRAALRARGAARASSSPASGGSDIGCLVLLSGKEAASSPAPTSRRSRASPTRWRPRPARASATGCSPPGRRCPSPPWPPSAAPAWAAASSSPSPPPTGWRATGRRPASASPRCGSASCPAGAARPACRAGSASPRRSTSSSPARRCRRGRAWKLGLVDALLPDARFLDEVRATSPCERRDKPRREEGRTDFKELLLEKNPLGRQILFDQARKKTLEHDPRPLPGAAARHRGGAGGHRGRRQGRLRRRGAGDRRARHLADVEEPGPRLPAHRGGQEGARASRVPSDPRRGRSARPPCSAPASWAAASPSWSPTRPSCRCGMKDVRGEALASGMAHRRPAVRAAGRAGAAWSAPRRGARWPCCTPPSTTPASAGRPGDRGDRREAGGQAGGLRRDSPSTCAEGAVLASNTSSLSIAGDRREDAAPRAGGRHALLQPGRTRCRWSR